MRRVPNGLMVVKHSEYGWQVWHWSQRLVHRGYTGLESRREAVAYANEVADLAENMGIDLTKNYGVLREEMPRELQKQFARACDVRFDLRRERSGLDDED